MTNNKQWTATMLLIVVSIFLVALNMRPVVTGIGPLFNVLMDALSVSNTQMSLLTSMPVFCMGLFAPIAVPFQKKFGTKWAIGLLVMFIAVANGLRFLQESYLLLLVTSFIAGLAIAMIGPILNAYIKEQFPNRFATVVGVYSFGIGTGATLSAGLSVTIYHMFDHSWTIALGSWTVLAVVALIIWLLVVRKAPIVGQEVPVTISEGARNPWRSGRAWTILIYFGLQTSLFFSLMSWLSPMLQDKGFSLVAASSVLTFMSIVQMFGNIVIPLVMEKWPNRIYWLLALSTIGVIGFI